jgi:hypothetical protein
MTIFGRFRDKNSFLHNAGICASHHYIRFNLGVVRSFLQHLKCVIPSSRAGAVDDPEDAQRFEQS